MVGVGMTTEEYQWLRSTIKKTVTANYTSSIWVALGLTAAGVFAALWIAVFSTDMPAATRGEFETAAWGFAGVGVIFFVVHWLRWRESSTKADELLAQIQMMVQMVDVQPEPLRVPAAPASPSPSIGPTGVTPGARRGRQQRLYRQAAEQSYERAKQDPTLDATALAKFRKLLELPPVAD